MRDADFKPIELGSDESRTGIGQALPKNGLHAICGIVVAPRTSMPQWSQAAVGLDHVGSVSLGTLLMD